LRYGLGRDAVQTEEAVFGGQRKGRVGFARRRCDDGARTITTDHGEVAMAGGFPSAVFVRFRRALGVEDELQHVARAEADATEQYGEECDGQCLQ
jgi:hypothetical protein